MDKPTTKYASKDEVKKQVAQVLELAKRAQGVSVDDVATQFGLPRTAAGWRVLKLKRDGKLHKFTAPGNQYDVRYFADPLTGAAWVGDVARASWNVELVQAMASRADGVTTAELREITGEPDYKQRRHLIGMQKDGLIFRVDFNAGCVAYVRWFSTDEAARAWCDRNPGAVVADVPEEEPQGIPAGPRAVLTPVDMPLQIGRVPRPGEADHEQFPSRCGNKLFYRDGRVEEIT